MTDTPIARVDEHPCPECGRGENCACDGTTGLRCVSCGEDLLVEVAAGELACPACGVRAEVSASDSSPAVRTGLGVRCECCEHEATRRCAYDGQPPLPFCDSHYEWHVRTAHSIIEEKGTTWI